MKDDMAALRAALVLEDSLEGYELSVLKDMLSSDVFHRLSPLFNPTHHDRLLAAYDARSDTPWRTRTPPSVIDALYEVLASERGARNFYTRHAPKLSDPELVTLFEHLATEEKKHMDIVREIIGELEDTA